MHKRKLNCDMEAGVELCMYACRRLFLIFFPTSRRLDYKNLKINLSSLIWWSAIGRRKYHTVFVFISCFLLYIYTFTYKKNYFKFIPKICIWVRENNKFSYHKTFICEKIKYIGMKISKKSTQRKSLVLFQRFKFNLWTWHKLNGRQEMYTLKGTLEKTNYSNITEMVWSLRPYHATIPYEYPLGQYCRLLPKKIPNNLEKKLSEIVVTMW